MIDGYHTQLPDFKDDKLFLVLLLRIGSGHLDSRAVSTNKGSKRTGMATAVL